MHKPKKALDFILLHIMSISSLVVVHKHALFLYTTTTKWTVRLRLRHLLSLLSLHAHVHVIDNMPHDLLIGRPWFHAVQSTITDQEDGLCLQFNDPTYPGRRVTIPTHEQSPLQHLGEVNVLDETPQTVESIPITPSPLSLFQASDVLFYHSQSEDNRKTSSTPRLLHTNANTVPGLLTSTYAYDEAHHVLAYKKVSRHVVPVSTTMPEHARPIRRFPEDPLKSLPALSAAIPASFQHTAKLTPERIQALRILDSTFLWEEEKRLVLHVLQLNERTLAWDETEKGQFREDYFAPVIIPVVDHPAFTERSIPIPPGIVDEVVQIV